MNKVWKVTFYNPKQEIDTIYETPSYKRAKKFIKQTKDMLDEGYCIKLERCEAR